MTVTRDRQTVDAVEKLATALSVAVRVEPELIRAVRLELFPRLGVETESDLWFSGLVRSQGPKGLVFDTGERHRLQRRLERWLRQQHPDAPVHSLWRIIQHVHTDLSPALLLEEQVTWLAVAGRSGEIDDALAPALKAVTLQNRDGLKQWLASAWERLPQAVRDSSTGWQLAQTARPRFPARRFPFGVERVPLPARRLGDLARVLDDILITVRRDGDELEIDGQPVDPEAATEVPPDSYALPVPDTAPRVLTLLAGGPRERDEDLSVPVAWQLRVHVGPGPVLLRSARGHVFRLPERAAPVHGAGLAGRFLGISVARYEHAQLPPLDHSPDLCREVGAAFGDTYAKEYLADPSLAAVTERLARLSARRHDGPLVVYVRGYALPGRRSGGPNLAFRDSDPDRPDTVLTGEDLFRLATGSGADQVLVLLDTVRPPGSGDGWGYPPLSMELRTASWTGQISVLVPHDAGWDRLFGSWLVRLLRHGPDSGPQGWGWAPRDRFITGGELMRAVALDWPGDYPSTPRNFATGVPRELLPNPRYALRDFPDDLNLADFGEAYAQEAAAFLGEVIRDSADSPEDRERAVSTMLRLGPDRGVEAAVALDDLAERFAAAGRRADAAAAHQHAIDLLRPLAEQRPDRAWPALGSALYGLAGRLAEAYRWTEARPYAEEAVDLRRRLAATRPDQRPRLAESLHLWSLVLRGVGLHDAALDAAVEAADLFGRLTADDPDEHRSALAVCLGSLANRYGEVGLPEHALTVAVQAEVIRRAQAESDPEARADLARSLHVRWYWERSLGHAATAHATMTECVTMRRELAALRPEAHRPKYAESLNCLAVGLADLGHIGRAMAPAREAVSIYRELVAGGAVDLRQPLARAQRNLSLWLGALGRPAEAVSAASDAVSHYRELEAEQKGLHRADLADALAMWSGALDQLGEGRPRALDAARQAVALYRELFAAEPDKYRRALARSVNTLSIRLDALGRSEEAARLRKEVRDIVSGALPPF
ncbi:Tetratricopeptide repeat-containing protein [Streptomyces sp. cf386]|uniref:tetratricopeptide repeat protein n=1 Tax=Streptomyces sp. cf386 TaxID=1761904 RepID=UPI0008925198|nr:tetratricopeptide repeat protein [Streptomyces sp. cf386]SDO93036.1 Tetratricopeptide repeat-containing protein [Streptomyces sp. cf386]